MFCVEYQKAHVYGNRNIKLPIQISLNTAKWKKISVNVKFHNLILNESVRVQSWALLLLFRALFEESLSNFVEIYESKKASKLNTFCLANNKKN